MYLLIHFIFVYCIDPPELNITQTPSGDLIRGSQLTLNCTVNSRPAPIKFAWYNLTSHGPQLLGCSAESDTECLLEVPVLDIPHSGTYQCSAYNGVSGYTRLNKTITIYG